jgi:hypothetical protein
MWSRSLEGNCLTYQNSNPNSVVAEVYIAGHIQSNYYAVPIPGSINITCRLLPATRAFMQTLKSRKFRWFSKIDAIENITGFLEVTSTEDSRTIFAVPAELVQQMEELCTLLQIPFFMQDREIFLDSEIKRKSSQRFPALR